MILVIDNYDSFVHNLARYFRQLGCRTHTVRNDQIDVDAVKNLRPQAIVISPGPCTPQQAGYSVACVSDFFETVPILGVCLGHQAIVRAFGGEVLQSGRPMHGRQSEIFHQGSDLFAGLPESFAVGRYHSLIADQKSLPECLHVTSRLEDGTIMSVQHHSRPVVGVQFHPESILTQHGHRLIANFCMVAGIEAPMKSLHEKQLTP